MSAWIDFLQSRDGIVQDGVVAHFGNPQAELAAAASGSIIADLSHLDTLRLAGADAVDFLHGQVSCDVKSLGPASSRYGSYSTPKGRMLANFLLWREGDAIVMLLARDLTASVKKRLTMYVLRSKVTITQEPGVLLGMSGPKAVTALAQASLPAPADVHAIARGANGETVIQLPGHRFLVSAGIDQGRKIWEAASRELTPAGATAWQWLEITQGLPLVTAATQDQFVPQMANLELIGGVSFQKGCYPGQEIVARMHYLGKVKRRMYRAHVESDVAPGDELFADDLPDQASGMIINAAPSPQGGYDVLAVAQTTSIQQSTVRLRSSSGPALRILDLPYSVS